MAPLGCGRDHSARPDRPRGGGDVPRRRCGEAALPKDRLRALRDAVRGRVLTPGDSGYNGARVVFNTRWDGVKPPAVVQVRDTADVRAVVQWADRYDVPLVARSGGHGYNGN